LFHGALEYRMTAGAHYAAPVVTEVRAGAGKAPQIVLKGANPMSLRVGGVWEEPGYMALDSENRDITAQVTVSGAVDTSRAGWYEVVYEVPATESAQAARKTRAVQVTAGDTDEGEPPAPTPGGSVAPPPFEPAQPGDPRAVSNPIAATTDSNPARLAQGAEPGGAGRVTRPELPDLSGLRPDAPPIPPPTVTETVSATGDVAVENAAVLEEPKGAALDNTHTGTDAAQTGTMESDRREAVTEKTPEGGPAKPSNRGPLAVLALFCAVVLVGGALLARLAYRGPVRRNP
ncbi:MAG: DUF5011 domain-containing protein, partial [Candidatus Hydrogenedens sp.]|nr:DUF5011 domain-containing protein [Candidatus Hydrogenedens sp.]